MSWLDAGTGRLVRLAAACGLAALVAGCFQPLYGERNLETGEASLREKLSAVEVPPIDAPRGSPEARLAVEVRNAMLFNLSGGGYVPSPAYRLKLALASARQQVIVDITTARPDVENFGIDATYTLTDLTTDKIVVTGRTFSRVTFDNPGQMQRFARARALRDAENRAAKVIADNVQMRLASFFKAGT